MTRGALFTTEGSSRAAESCDESPHSKRTTRGGSKEPGLGNEAVPGPLGDVQILGDIEFRVVVTGHGGCGGPGEVIVEGAAEAVVVGEADINEGLIETGDGALVHVFVEAVAAVNADDGSFIAVAGGVSGGSAEGFGPIGGEALGVVRVEAVAEGMGDDLVFEDAFVPGGSQFAHAVETTSGLEESQQGLRIVVQGDWERNARCGAGASGH